MAGLDGVLRVPPEETLAEWWRLVRRLVVVALGTALRRGELLALRWQDVAMLEGRLTVRQSFVHGEFTTPKSRTSRRTIELGPQMQAALGEQWEASRYRGDDDLVFGHPALGSPLDAAKLSRDYMRPALKRAKIEKPFRPWHDLRHTALTHEAAAGNPQAYVQHKAATRRARLPSATSTPPRCSFRAPPRRAKRGSSARS